MSERDPNFKSSTLDSDWRLVGKVKDAHSLKGELFILIFSGDISWMKKLKNVKIEDRTHVVSRVKPFKEGLLISLQGVTDRTQAEAMKGKSFLIPTELLISGKGEVIYLSEIQDFLLIANGVQIAPIHGFSSNGAQDLLLVHFQNHEVAIPFVADFIAAIDFDKKCVNMNLPEGLLEVESSKKK